MSTWHSSGVCADSVATQNARASTFQARVRNKPKVTKQITLFTQQRRSVPQFVTNLTIINQTRLSYLGFVIARGQLPPTMRRARLGGPRTTDKRTLAQLWVHWHPLPISRSQAVGQTSWLGRAHPVRDKEAISLSLSWQAPLPWLRVWRLVNKYCLIFFFFCQERGDAAKRLILSARCVWENAPELILLN